MHNLVIANFLRMIDQVRKFCKIFYYKIRNKEMQGGKIFVYQTFALKTMSSRSQRHSFHPWDIFCCWSYVLAEQFFFCFQKQQTFCCCHSENLGQVYWPRQQQSFLVQFLISRAKKMSSKSSIRELRMSSAMSSLSVNRARSSLAPSQSLETSRIKKVNKNGLIFMKCP